MTLKLILLLVPFAIGISGNSQKIIIGGKETKRQLQWTDFVGEVDDSSPYFALTWWNLRFRYQGVQFSGEAATLSGFEVILEFNPQKSWLKRDKESDELLEHEQGHFNMGILCMKEIISTVNKTSFRKNDYSEVIQNLFNSTMDKYRAMGDLYDNETNHGSNREQQRKWNSFIKTKLRE